MQGVCRLIDRKGHRKDGKVFIQNDDLMSATRYAVMMLRFVETVVPVQRRRPAY
jgi:hypothetical protein